MLRQATSDKRQATSDKRRATSVERQAAGSPQQAAHDEIEDALQRLVNYINFLPHRTRDWRRFNAKLTADAHAHSALRNGIADTTHVAVPIESESMPCVEYKSVSEDQALISSLRTIISLRTSINSVDEALTDAFPAEDALSDIARLLEDHTAARIERPENDHPRTASEIRGLNLEEIEARVASYIPPLQPNQINPAATELLNQNTATALPLVEDAFAALFDPITTDTVQDPRSFLHRLSTGIMMSENILPSTRSELNTLIRATRNPRRATTT